jgi:hypothetical protein
MRHVVWLRHCAKHSTVQARCTNRSSCRRNVRPGVRRALFPGLGSSTKSGYSLRHSPTGRRPSPKQEQREPMQQGCQISLLAVPSPWHLRTSLTNRSTRTPTLAMASPSSWPMLVPCGPIGPPAPVNSGVRPHLKTTSLRPSLRVFHLRVELAHSLICQASRLSFGSLFAAKLGPSFQSPSQSVSRLAVNARLPPCPSAT